VFTKKGKPPQRRAYTYRQSSSSVTPRALASLIAFETRQSPRLRISSTVRLGRPAASAHFNVFVKGICPKKSGFFDDFYMKILCTSLRWGAIFIPERKINNEQ
jgi:hypothetical protein